MQTSTLPIKTIIRQARVRQWEISEYLGMDESLFSKKLRREPPESFRQEILQAIEAIQQAKSQ
ncbi:MAG: hypothetical protein IJ121_02915 [Eubacterium sp.]|nr:hypothetical protein [Eubacterium sp.]